MKKTVTICILALFCAIATVTAGHLAASPDTVSLTGAGATFPNPIYSKWFDSYHNKFPNIQINYQSLGSGAGIKQVTEGTVDFGASDGPMNDDQLKEFQTKQGFPVLHFPT